MNDYPAEQAILGCILASPGLLDHAISKGVHPMLFGNIKNKIIFKTIVRLKDQGITVDIITLIQGLKDSGELEAAGGIGYVSSIDEFIPDTGLLESYISSAKATFVRGKMKSLARDISKMSQSELGLEDLMSGMSASISEVIELGRGGTSSAKTASEAIGNVVDHYKSGGEKLIRTGYEDLDNLLFGLSPGALIVLAGRPGMGKTSLMLDMAQNAASLSDAKVGIFSLEMGSNELGAKILARQSGIPSSKMKHGMLTDQDWEHIKDIQEDIAGMTINIEDSGSISSIEQMISRAKMMKMEEGLDLLCVDYLQLMHSSTRTGNRTEEVSIISRRLKQLAKDLQIPVIAVSQLSRAVESRSDKRPMLSDLRESGSIEQDADVVGFVYRPGYYKKTPDTTGTTELLIAKHRAGPVGTVYLKWNADITSFSEAVISFTGGG